jgi:hypothetical protein
MFSIGFLSVISKASCKDSMPVFHMTQAASTGNELPHLRIEPNALLEAYRPICWPKSSAAVLHNGTSEGMSRLLSNNVSLMETLKQGDRLCSNH